MTISIQKLFSARGEKFDKKREKEIIILIKKKVVQSLVYQGFQHLGRIFSHSQLAIFSENGIFFRLFVSNKKH